MATDELKAEIKHLFISRNWDPDRLRWLIALLCEVEDDWRAEARRREEELAAGFWNNIA